MPRPSAPTMVRNVFRGMAGPSIGQARRSMTSGGNGPRRGKLVHHRRMSKNGSSGRLFPALLRYWRTRRGLSQLELGLQANVSARHVSFLESGRARPSEAMVLRLFAVMNVPLGDQNGALGAAGFRARFLAPPASELPTEVEKALERMMAQHEPFPLSCWDSTARYCAPTRARHTCSARSSRLRRRRPDPSTCTRSSLIRRLLRPSIVNWEPLARSIVSRLHREFLQSGDARSGSVLDRIFALDVPREWQHPNFSDDAAPTLRLYFARNEMRAGFLSPSDLRGAAAGHPRRAPDRELLSARRNDARALREIGARMTAFSASATSEEAAASTKSPIDAPWLASRRRGRAPAPPARRVSSFRACSMTR